MTLPSVEATARGLVAELAARPATLGRTRLVCVDGPAGAGKTTLGAALRRAGRDIGRVELLHMDNVYDGWAGLAAGMATVADDVVAPLRDGRTGRYRRYDWHRGAFAEERLVAPVDLLVVEGVGAGNAAYADAITCLVWVETPTDVRTARGLARDGVDVREHWAAWQAQEAAMLAEHRVRERADVVVDGLS